MLMPVEGTWVRRRGETRIGRVLAMVGEGQSTVLTIEWGDGETSEPLSAVESGMQPGFAVQDVPSSIGRRGLGVGRIRAVRRLAGVDQALVQWQSDGRSLWVPSFGLRRLMDAELAFLRSRPAHDDCGERFALCVVGHALRSWNEATGALDRLDVDPLPHQIQLVHRIVTSGDTNWIIADDVGLGKTIEVGLLLAALQRSRSLRRVLVVCPAGLTRQWQDEMRVKFDREFMIYGSDFQVDEDWKWRLQDAVIASLDLVKPRDREDDGSDPATHFGRLMMAGVWDLVIFDEGHRLSRTDDGSQTLRFLLGRALRERTASLLLLTGTPHQGDTGKFRSLLKLVRPDLAPAIDELELHPEVVGDIVLRNRKIDVTDAEGAFIFQGHTVTQVGIEPSAEMRELDRRLQTYLRSGYRAGERLGGSGGRAIGFVMTTYRKLASSSVAAIERALRRRLERLAPGAPVGLVSDLPGWDDEDTLDDAADRDLGGPAGEFFADEAAMIRGVLVCCAAAAEADAKIREFRRIYEDVVVKGGRKMLVFSEYRATQDRLLEEVRRLSGRDGVQINGGQRLFDKLAAIEAFDGDVQVLVSTEAGGEGLNLQRNCHVVVNYDLPWNPARIVQRIGRVYRYGQKRHVVVLNFLSRDTIDADILSTALTRVDALSREMASVSGEFDGRYASEILGELLDQLDLSALLADAATGAVERTDERIAEAVARARRARDLQDEILSQAGGFDPTAMARLGRFTTADVLRFVLRMAPYHGYEVTNVDDRRERLTLRLGDRLRGRHHEFGGRTVIEATTSRAAATASRSLTLLDFSSSFLRELVAISGSPEFGGGYASLALAGRRGQVAAFLGRWQSEQGETLAEELHLVRCASDGRPAEDEGMVAALLSAPVISVEPARANDSAARRQLLDGLRAHVETSASGQVTRQRMLNDLVLLAAADVV
ncbi:DEAD/DEAH box helicase [Sphingomonas sp. RHCKR7]|uniref:DEAD/DEAH box helicase n=1 Tax=Sphingomonas folli TaxID=2862497 RepID=UPI001C67DFF8|nr:DEAD/DEAH box helicase [Sphingomonas folli]MBW6525254.1 DEAD/DEAH box helicase [Sphingomonas folli]